MPISLIAAMSLNRVIGKANKIPWKIPGEQNLFRSITEGHIIIMGRKTFESIGRPLPMRTNIILTRKADYSIPDCIVFNNLSSALNAYEKQKVFIIGGQGIFKQSLPFADNIFLTIVQKKFMGDTYFPEFSTTEFQIIKQEWINASIPYQFIHYKRIAFGDKLDNTDGNKGAIDCPRYPF